MHGKPSLSVGSVGSVPLFILTGELDMANVDVLAGALADVALDAPVIVDLTDVTFVDSTVLNVLVDRHRASSGKLVAIVPESSPLRRILAITHLDGYLRIVTERAAAGRLAVVLCEAQAGAFYRDGAGVNGM